jgi:hypothetical protein
MAKAYVGRVGPGGKPIRRLNDILPFRWIDLGLLIPLLAGATWYYISRTWAPETAKDYLSIVFGLVVIVALYGAVVFPIRYYLWRLPMAGALAKYLVSTLILFVMFVGAFLVAYSMGAFPEEPVGFTTTAAVIWGIFTLMAFSIYGVLSGHRAIRSFRSNIRKL